MAGLNDKTQFEIMDMIKDDMPKTTEREKPLKLPKRLYLLPLVERPFFPPQTLPILLDIDPWLKTIEKASESKVAMLGLVLSRSETSDDANPNTIFTIGTAIRLHQPTQTESQVQVIAEGVCRFKIKKWIHKTPPYLVEVEYPEDTGSAKPEQDKAYTVAIINTLKELIPLNPLYSEELKYFLKRFIPNDPSHLADFAASLTSGSRDELQNILSTLDVSKRLKKVVSLLKKEIDMVKLQAHISEEVEERMNEQQRQFFLTEQMKAIQKELGIAKDDRTAEIDRFEEKIHHADIPPHALARIEEEMDKLAVLELGSPEYTITRNYLDILTNLPWNHMSKDKLSLQNARRILNKEHESLDDIKDRIIEFIAIGALRGKIGGSILLFVGPPGVGKTSIGRSIAHAVGRKFYRFSVGGMRDEAEIKGHRRTYVGAMPGKIIQCLKEVNVSNPIIMIDEIDKIGNSYQGDPASALLEVLDPEQNKDFLDHYLDVRFDCSKIMFICTANQIDTIPQALLDRMEVMHLAGYLNEEKMKIAQKHLWPRCLKNSGLTKSQLRLTEAGLRMVIDEYARESGVRGLQKYLGRIARKAAVKIVSGKADKIVVGSREIQQYLGIPPFEDEQALQGVGIVTGLAWTALGGAILSIEATQHETQNRGFKFTGQMGDVMKESAEIAYSYVLSSLSEYHINPYVFHNSMVHLHIPEGATPKDGPSAGITMATALFSLARGIPIVRPLAMTGEITLTGHVLAVGGIREKLIAAKRAHITEIILPEAVRKDYLELPKFIKDGLKIHFVKHYRDVYKIVFG
jgi:ATP-dependent Lon protease